MINLPSAEKEIIEALEDAKSELSWYEELKEDHEESLKNDNFHIYEKQSIIKELETKLSQLTGEL